LVDFCLNGNGQNIYTDPEFKEKHNTTIENFLVDNRVTITLKLKTDLDDENSEELVIKRNFLKYSEKVFEINGESYKNKQYDTELKKAIFNTEIEKPSIRQIVARNIRDEKNKLVNTIQVLHPTTTLEEYEALFFFWFGIETDVAGRKQKLQEQKKSEEKFLARLKKQHAESEIQQALIIINRDIDELTKLKGEFVIDDNYERDLNFLSSIKFNITQSSTEISKLTIRRDIIRESKRELEEGYARIDNDILKEIYTTAEAFLPEMHKRFEDLVTFHNRMQQEKVNFITEELPALEAFLTYSKKELSELIKHEREVSEKIRKANATQELENIVENLNKKYEQKGVYETQQKQILEARGNLTRIKSEIDGINSGLTSKDDDLEKQVAEFNKYFSEITQALYDEKFILYTSKTERAYQLKIASIEGHLGTGKKKGQIAAFDLAYIEYCDANDIPCLHFVMQDQIENIHDNQLKILAELTEEINAQYITPVLRDKIPDGIDIDQFAVVVLSQTDKLFKV